MLNFSMFNFHTKVELMFLRHLQSQWTFIFLSSHYKELGTSRGWKIPLMGNIFHYYPLQKYGLQWLCLLTCICPQEPLIHAQHSFPGATEITEQVSYYIFLLLMMDHDFSWIILKITWFLQVSFLSFLQVLQAWKTEQSFTKYNKNSSGGHSIILLKLWERTVIAKRKCRTEHVYKKNEVFTSYFSNGQSQLRW